MKILLTIAHYYRADGSNQNAHASLRASAARDRIQALTTSLLALHTIAGSSQMMFDIQHRSAHRANGDHQLEVIIVTDADGHHVLNQLPFQPESYYQHHVASELENPKHLGFVCQRVLANHLPEHYDLYGFLEDDLILHDPSFFDKVAWFAEWTHQQGVLMPNRYEVSPRTRALKAYIDGAIRPEATQAFQERRIEPQLEAEVFGQSMQFIRPSNPHAGCYFLTYEQLSHWAAQADFAVPSDAFISPLESAASLGVMRHFRVYKPADFNASFLEIQHAGSGFIQYLGPKSQGSADQNKIHF
jgi:hypothetical protein